MYRFLIAATLVIFSLGISAKTYDDKSLYALLDDIWQYELSVSPLLASRQGNTELAHALPDISIKGLEEQNKHWLDYQSELANYNENNLTQEAYIALLMQQYRLANYIDQYKYRDYLVPINSEYGFHSAMASLPNLSTFKRVTDYKAYISRLQGLKPYFEQQIAYMEQALSEGYTQPRVVLEGFENSISTYLVDDVKDSGFYSPFMQFPDYFSDTEKASLEKQGQQAVRQFVLPAYQAFYDFMVNEYIPGSRTTIAAEKWPNGVEYYANRAKHYTTTDMTPQEIHELGLSEVARIRAQMQQIVDDLEFDGSINAFITFLREDPQFYATSAEELLKEASFIAKKMDAKLPSLFEYLPRTPYGVAPVPDAIAPKYTTGRYIHPSRDDEPGYYWVNTYALDKRPLYALPALTLHEAVPGHHLQISLAAELENLPMVRRNTYISAFGEGWGLYSEFLGIEAGIYEDPYDNFGRLSYEMWRACRLVVDTGMHTMGWSRQKGVDYMMENTALSEHNVNTEIDRYISWPAQALSYKIGEIKIKALRQKAESALGEHFDVRKFHRAVLENGSVPLFILEQNIDAFIEEQKAKEI
ncbi:MAG: DUF885 domain-containing protein [Alteromonas sp.]|jgi:uncharacterized protein (DUF885 family)|uniref:DUF885 domain-containing protein n=1 Tax=unclassified Alteromonas TaxID=2614992 RepID=UPI00090333EA|nr:MULTISPECIES: DUF885 domain-containing protein [unclassified Alteromonas]APE04394.1 hypothetical protein BM528_00225 [Alteromonas sp. RW2A1]AUC86799.1 DUF885 domain-containing protein [Alteromonas sp. MB-3u-76]MAI65055.1 DUF885 domain-containing protein [Alteromonas sp.]